MVSFALEEMKGSVTTWLFVGPPIHSKGTGARQPTEDGPTALQAHGTTLTGCSEVLLKKACSPSGTTSFY